MRTVRAVVFGVGAMNSVATRFMLDKGVQIVGAISRSPKKVGRDLGEITDLGYATGVKIEADARHVLSTRSADIALVAIASYMQDMYEHLRLCAECGVNALTLSEEALYPWNTSPVQTAHLDRLAKAQGVTITGSGHQDVYWLNLISMWMGTAHRIESVTGRASWNVDDYGPELAKETRAGNTLEEFTTWQRETNRPPTFGRNTLGALIASLGLTPTSVSTSTRPDLASVDTYSRSLNTQLPAGHVIGYTDIDTVVTREGLRFSFEMSGRVYQEGETDINEWSLTGEPNLKLSNPALPTAVTTVAQFVNRIPDVINAPPGFVTCEQLPPLKYRAFGLGMYVAD